MFLEVIVSLLSVLQKGLLSVGPFILLLGVLIFIHELGHFLAARYCDVKVEVFSLGFGPKILKYKKGDTLYCLSLLPLGGYVKMIGDNPLEEPTQEERRHGFLYKKVPQKLFIAAAGPLMNLFFTLAAFLFLGWIGIPALPSIVGDIEFGTPAYKSGLRSGDTIVSVNNQAVTYWDDVDKIINNTTDSEITLEVAAQNNKTKKYNLPVESKINENIFVLKKEMNFVEGLSNLSTGAQVGVKFNSRSYKAGLRSFDVIEKVNDQSILYWRDFTQEIKKTNYLNLSIKREGELLNVKIKNSNRSLKSLGIEASALYISAIGPNTPAQKAGLQAGDRLISINNVNLRSWLQVLEIVQSHSGDKKLKVTYRRQGKIHTVDILPKVMYVEGQIKEKVMIGIVSSSYLVPPPELIQKAGFLGAFVFSGEQTWHWLKVISVGLFRLVQGEVSVRTLGGPVTIGRIAHKSFRTGFVSFIMIMALISLNLFFLNLLPIPILDGGHILFFTIEGIMGRPLDTKKLIAAQGLGFIVLISFLGFTFFNDIYNWLTAWQ